MSSKVRIFIKEVPLFFKVFDFIRWKCIDIYRRLKYGREFDYYGVRFFTGRQGSGKTISVVHHIGKIKKTFPDCLVVANFDFEYRDQELTDWRQMLELRNGKDGIIFVIDEIQNEYSSTKWKDFPDHLLSEITQLRKQKIYVVVTSQVFTRVVKPLREQAFWVVDCYTFFKRWTFQTEYDADDYNTFIDDPEKKQRLPRLLVKRSSFVQSDKIRNLFNTEEKVTKMAKVEFIPRHERSS